MFQVPLAGQSINTAQIGIETNISSSSATIGNASITNATVGQLSTTIFNPASVTTTTLDANVGQIGTLTVTNPVANLLVTELNCCTINASVKNVCNISAIHISALQITCDNLQPLLTAGPNISILNGVISAGNDALLPSIANFSTVNSHIINSSFFVSNLVNAFHTSTVSISSNHASFVSLTANNLSTGDLNFGSNISYNQLTKHLDVNVAKFVTENDGRPVTSWAVYKEFVNRLSEQVNNIQSVHFFRLSDPAVTLVTSQVAAGQNDVIFRVDFTPQYEGSRIAVEVCYSYRLGGFGTDNVTTDLQIGTDSNQSQVVIQRIEQNWTGNSGGGTRGGDAGSIMGVYDNTDTLGKFHRVQLKVYNFSDDLWQLESVTQPAIKITEILRIETVNNPNIRIGSGNISCGNISCSNLSCTQISVANFVVQNGDITTSEGLNAGGGFITMGFSPLGTIASLSRLRMAGGAVLTNSADADWNGTTFNISMRQPNKDFKVSIAQQPYLEVNTTNTSTRSLVVNGNLSVSGTFGVNSLELNSLVLNGLSTFQSARFNNNVSILGHLNTCNVSIHGNVSIIGFATISGNLSMLGNISARHISAANLSTASLVAGQNISILNGSISAFITGGNDIDVRNLHVDEDVNIVGLLHVSETSTFKQSLNVCNIIYAGDAGEQDGSVVVYSQEIGNNWATKFDDDKLNMSATGLTQEANIWVGGNKTLSVTATGVNVSGTITASQFNFSLDNISMTNLSSVNITADSIISPSVQPTLTAGSGIVLNNNVISTTQTLVAGENLSILNDIISTIPNINVSKITSINGSFTNLTCSNNISFPIGQFLYRDFTGLLNVSELEIENIILGDLALSFKSAQINTSKLNVSNISFTGIGGGTLDMGGFGVITKVGTITTLNMNASQSNTSSISTNHLSATHITSTSVSASNLSTASLGLSDDLYILSNVLYVDFSSATDAATAEVNSLASALATNVSTTSVSSTFGTIGLLTINTLVDAPTINVSTLSASSISANSITAPNLQLLLTPGSGINISNNVISTTQTLVAGNNLQIIGNDISTTTTINSSVHIAGSMNTSILNTSDIDAPMGEIDNLSSINFSAIHGTITTLTGTSITAPNLQLLLTQGSGINISNNVISTIETLSAGNNISILNDIVSLNPNINVTSISASSVTAPNLQLLLTQGSGINISNNVISTTQTLVAGNNLQIIGNDISTTTTINSSVHIAGSMNTSILNTSDIDSILGEIDNLSSINFSATTGTITTLQGNTLNSLLINASNINISTKLTVTNGSFTRANFTTDIITPKVTTEALNTSSSLNFNINNVPSMELGSALFMYTDIQGTNGYFTGNISGINGSFTSLSASSISAPNLQEKLIPGSGINLSNNVISTSPTQTLVGSENISILNDIIKTTTTINSSVHIAGSMNTSILNTSDIDSILGEIDNLSSINFSATTGTITTFKTNALNVCGLTKLDSLTVFGAGATSLGTDEVTVGKSNAAGSQSYISFWSPVTPSQVGLRVGIFNTGFASIDLPYYGQLVNRFSINISNASYLTMSNNSTRFQKPVIFSFDVTAGKITSTNISNTNLSSSLVTTGTLRAITSNGTTMNSSNINISNKLTTTNISATNITATSITAPNVQPTLTAGTNISIVGTTISATGSSLTAGSNISILNGVVSLTPNISVTNISATAITAPNVQPTLIAGTNISIVGTTISATGSSLTAGNNIQIIGNDILTTTTINSSVHIAGTMNTSILNTSDIDSILGEIDNLSSINFSATTGTITTLQGNTLNSLLINASNINISTKLTVTNGSFTNTTASRIDASSRIVITHTEPTLYLKDTNHRSGMIHMNNSRMYFLSGATNSETWSQVNSQWPLILHTNNNQAVFGGGVTINTGNFSLLNSNGVIRATNGSFTSLTASSITAPNVQPTLIAGTNISIVGTTISATGSSLTAGSNISILNGVVSLNPNISVSNQSVINGSFSALTCSGNISFPIGFALYRDFTGLLNVCDIQIKGLFGSTFSATAGNFSKINVSNVSFTGLGPKMSMGGLGQIFGVGTYTGLNCNVSQINASNISCTNFSGGLGTFSGALTIGGALTLTNQPRFLAYYQGSTAPLVINANVVLFYNTVKYNLGGGAYNTTSCQYTIPQTGYYEFYCGFATQGTTSDVYLERNGTSIGRMRSTGQVQADSSRYIVVQTICNVNDTIRCINRLNSIRLSPNGTLHQGIHQFGGFRFA
jgi:hypothetical protein